MKSILKLAFFLRAKENGLQLFVPIILYSYIRCKMLYKPCIRACSLARSKVLIALV